FALENAARVDAPDVDERVAADAMVVVVEIDGRIAMGRHQLDRRSELERSVAGREDDAAMLVAEILVTRARGSAGGELRRGGVRREALEAAVDVDEALGIRADDGVAHEERRLERRLALFEDLDLIVFDIHHRVGAGLVLRQHIARAVDAESARAAAR